MAVTYAQRKRRELTRLLGQAELMNRLNCARCNVALEFVGTRDFHEGTRWGALGDLGELFVKKERFDVYVCPRCGGVEMFVDGIGEDLRSPIAPEGN